MKILKKILKILGISAVGFSLVMLVFVSAFKSLQFPSVKEISALDNVSAVLSKEEQETLKSSRRSSVRILSMSDEGRVASSTGTYFVSKGSYYVLTVNHGLVGDCALTRIWSEEEGFTPCARMVTTDPIVDYAIIEVEEIPSLTPIRLPKASPRPSEWKESLSTQTKVFYTGYPNSTGPLTLDGRIIGYADGDYIYINSFAWGGASGSGVFTAQGDFIGYILAIDIGRTEYGIDVLEDIVIVVPAFKIDWTTLSK